MIVGVSGRSGFAGEDCCSSGCDDVGSEVVFGMVGECAFGEGSGGVGVGVPLGWIQPRGLELWVLVWLVAGVVVVMVLGLVLVAVSFLPLVVVIFVVGVIVVFFAFVVIGNVVSPASTLSLL